MKTHSHFANRQRGVMLLEALISILIFSIGILAVIGLQANSIKLASDSKYRSDASLLANRLVGEMWMAHSSPTFATTFSSPSGASYVAWASSVAAALPGASAPTVAVSSVPNTFTYVGSSVNSTSTIATIDIYWSVPGESATGASAHHYSTQTEIFNN